MFNYTIAKRRSYGKVTQAANTAITRLIPPELGLFTTVADLRYLAAATAHTLTILRPIGKTYASAAAAAAQAVINIVKDPGDYDNFGTINTANNLIAANDYCVYQSADGTYVLDTVSSVSSLAITMTGNVPTSTVLKGAPFWFFGITTDTNPANNEAHPAFTMTAAGTTVLGGDPGDTMGGSLGSVAPPAAMRAMYNSTDGAWPLNGKNEPLIIYSNNATNAGTLERVTAIYTLIG